MAKEDKRYDKKYYSQHPTKLPEILKGHDFHAVHKTRLGSNQNRTTLFEFNPRQFEAVLESFEKSAKKKAAVTRAKVRRDTDKLKVRLISLKVRLKRARTQAASDAASLENLSETLEATVAERDEALAQVRVLSKKPSRASDDAKELKQVKRELERIRGRFDEKNNENKSLNDQLKVFQSGVQQDKIDLGKARKANADLTKFLDDLKAALIKNGVISDEPVQESSGMSTPGTVLSGSIIKITWPKPYRG